MGPRQLNRGRGVENESARVPAAGGRGAVRCRQDLDVVGDRDHGRVSGGGLLAAVAAQQRGYTVTGAGEVEEEDDAVLGYFCVTVPAFAAAIIGSVIWDGWGAAIGGVGAALVLSFAYAAVSERMA